MPARDPGTDEALIRIAASLEIIRVKLDGLVKLLDHVIKHLGIPVQNDQSNKKRR